MKHANELAAISAQKKVEVLAASVENAKNWVNNDLSSKLEDAANQGRQFYRLVTLWVSMYQPQSLFWKHTDLRLKRVPQLLLFLGKRLENDRT